MGCYSYHSAQVADDRFHEERYKSEEVFFSTKTLISDYADSQELSTLYRNDLMQIVALFTDSCKHDIIMMPGISELPVNGPR